MLLRKCLEETSAAGIKFQRRPKAAAKPGSDLAQIAGGDHRPGRLAGRRAAGGLEADGEHRAGRELLRACRRLTGICVVEPTGMTPIETGGFVPSIIHSSKSLPAARSPETCDRPTSPVRGIIDDQILDSLPSAASEATSRFARRLDGGLHVGHRDIEGERGKRCGRKAAPEGEARPEVRAAPPPCGGETADGRWPALTEAGGSTSG